MLTVRPYRNEDPPLLLDLWQQTLENRQGRLPLLPLSLSRIQTQILGQPFFDRRSIMLAFDDNMPVGYVHTSLNPLADGSGLDNTSGCICFLCAVPSYPDVFGAAATLIQAAEKYLKGLGVKTLYGGSPSPSVPFYATLYGGGEPVGILNSDACVVQAFSVLGYRVFQKTTCFAMDMRQYNPVYTPEFIGWYADSAVEISETLTAKSWWEGCLLANGTWLDATAYLSQTQRPIARLRTRMNYPEAEDVFSLYGGTWLASLMELRVHPDYQQQNIASFLLGELLRSFLDRNQVILATAHAAEGSLLHVLLQKNFWQKTETGCTFVKELQ